jgi:phosphatidylglycerol:prolipoprotein diacylglycerol transferase
MGPLADGIGRWGCFFSGCCWGTPTDLPWAVTFPEVGRRFHRGLPDVPLHPTQIYFSLVGFAIFLALAWLYRRKRFHGQIISTFLLLYAVTRFFLEYVRGDEERGFLLGGLVSTSQGVSLLFAAAGIAAYVALDRRHRASGEPDWKPAVARGGKRR